MSFSLLNVQLLVAGHNDSPSATISATAAVAEQQLQQDGNPACDQNNGSNNGMEQSADPEDLDLRKRYRSQFES